MSITMNFKRVDLLSLLKVNRDKHGEDYKKARKGWLKEVAEEGEKIVAAAKEGELRTRNSKVHRHPRHDHPMTTVLFEEPEDHTKEYDRIIEMLEMATDAEVKLNDSQFREYAQDEWGWKEAWDASNTKYMG